MVRWNFHSTVEEKSMQRRVMELVHKDEILAVVQVTPPTYGCPEDQWKCEVGDQCIPKEKRCDGVVGDCVDLTDEEFCSCGDIQASLMGKCTSVQVFNL